MRTLTLVALVGLLAGAVAGGPAQAAPARPGLQLCRDGLALGEARLAYPPKFQQQRARLRHNLPLLERALKRLDQGACVPAAPAVEALLQPVPPEEVGTNPDSVEAKVLRAWQRAWQQKEAVAAGLGAFLLLGQGAQWRSVEPGDPQGLAAGLRALARRAKPAGPDAEVLWLPCLTATADEGLREQAGRAARAFADGHARQRAQRQAELAADAKALELELLGHALGLARAAGELSGALEELSRLEELRRKLARERRPAPEQAPLDAALAARRGEAEARLLAALDGLAELAADRLARQQALAKVRAEQRVLGGRPARVLLHPAEPLPRRTEPREVVLLTSTPDGDPTRDGLALVLVQPVDEPPARPGARPGGKPRPPKRSRLKLEEEGVERASPELRPADGRAPPPADAAAAARASDEQACGMGNAPACYRFGLAAAEGSGGARDAVSARAALDRACDGGFALACHQLGLFMESGALGPADPDRARGYFGRACNDKLQKACDKIGR